MKNIIDKFFALVQRHPTTVHTFLTLWNTFFTSWATKIAVPLQDIGIPITINATAIVDWLQLHTHMPTAVVGVMTFIINAIVAYTAWKKQHTVIVDTNNKPMSLTGMGGDLLLQPPAPMPKTKTPSKTK